MEGLNNEIATKTNSLRFLTKELENYKEKLYLNSSRIRGYGEFDSKGETKESYVEESMYLYRVIEGRKMKSHEADIELSRLLERRFMCENSDIVTKVRNKLAQARASSSAEKK